MQCVNLVHDEVILLFSNWASAWRNHTYGESVLNLESLTEMFVRGTGSGLAAGIATERKLSNHRQFYFGIWVRKTEGPVKNQFQMLQVRDSTLSCQGHQNVAIVTRQRTERNKYILSNLQH